MLHTPVHNYDLIAREVRANPHPVLARMRTEAPVYRVQHYEMGSYPWLLTRYEDCVNLLKDERFTKDAIRRPGTVFDPTDIMHQAAMSINRHMLTVDPPDHTRLRGLVHKAFTPRMIRELAGRIEQIASDLLDKVEGQGHMDMMRDFAVPLPVTVIAEMLGVPLSDQAKFREWTQVIVNDGLKSAASERVATATLEFIMYFHALFDERRNYLGDDLISGLLQVEEAGDKLDQQELISMVFLLLVAGHETTVNLIANGTLALLTHPDQLKKLRKNPALMDSAIEEMLRFEGPVGASSMRWALEDMELHGQVIPAGDMVMASLLAANRDPAEFENPDDFDITRQPNRHIAFGTGIHYCLGAPLARLEGVIAFRALLDRLPNLQLDVDPKEIDWNETLLLHAMKSMPLRF